VRSSSRSSPAPVWLALLCLTLAGGCSDRQEAREAPGASGDGLVPAARPAPRPGRADGVYAVLAEAATADSATALAAAAGPGAAPPLVLPYDRRIADPATTEPPTWVALDTTSWVPLILEGGPEAQADGQGRTMLSVTLAREQIRPMEALTERQLGRQVAVLLDGDVISAHKVRAVIREGRMQISRCADDACEVIWAKLSD